MDNFIKTLMNETVGSPGDDPMTISLIKFGRWVKYWRDHFERTQEELGVLVGVKKAYISNIERAEPSSYTGKPSKPDIEIVDKLAETFNRPIMEARTLAGYGVPDHMVQTVEDAVNVTLLLDRKGLSDEDREKIRPLLQSTDLMIDLLSRKPTIDIKEVEPDVKREDG